MIEGLSDADVIGDTDRSEGWSRELVTQRYGDSDRGMIEGLSDDRSLGLNKS